MKNVITGIKSTGSMMHIGNYFGMIKPTISLQDETKLVVFIADLHSLNSIQDAKILKSQTHEIAIDWLACGIDPQKTIIFLQSQVAAHAELCWILDSVTPVSLLERSHAYKDAQAKAKSVNMGLFNYPVLMAADILLYDTDLVPVGRDQKQHVEITRDIANKFNNIYGQTFRLPEPLISDDLGIVVGTDGRKMSKSYDNFIGIFAEEQELKKKIMAIKTDNRALGEPLDYQTCNVFALHRLVTPAAELAELKIKYESGNIGYGDAKKLLLKNTLEYFAQMKKKYDYYQQNPELVAEILTQGAQSANLIAQKKLAEIKAKVGLKI